MNNLEDLLKAKQALSGRLLRKGFSGGVIGMASTRSVRTVVASAGRNVHGVGIGYKVVNGVTTKDPCVRLYVVQKVAASLLTERDILPKQIDGILTDVIQSSPAFLMAKKDSKPSKKKQSKAVCSSNRRKRQRPVMAGISAAHYEVTAGTISCFCRSTRAGDDPAKIYVMGNNHVLADVNKAQPGDDLYQPGPADGGKSTDHFAELFRFAKIQVDGSKPNRVDAAIGELLPNIKYDPRICTIGKIAGINKAKDGMKVCKHGRTTGYTEGMITDVSYDALIGMDHLDASKVAFFEDQMRIEKAAPYSSFGEGGDSGSLVVNKSNHKAVGLYFAGPESGVYGVANHIDDVLKELEVEFLL